MSDKELIGTYPFDINARVTIQLGRESISSSVIAFSELVKNSYDADAEDVNIVFSEEKGTNRSITIEDNGDGMSLETLLSRWLLIGTSNKRGDDVSASKKRALTGAKGLGRLGIDRLCEKLILQTKTIEMDELLELHVNWDRFEEEGRSLSDIQHDLFRVKKTTLADASFSFCESRPSGTRIILQGLKDEWSEELINELAKELSLLVSPFGGVNDFKVIIQNSEQVLLAVDPSMILNGAMWKLEAEIDAAGYATATLTSSLYGESIVMDPVLWSQWIKDSGTEPQCGPVKFVLYFLPQVKDVLERIDFATKDFRGFMHLNQGIRIYRDHFRVKPYGDPNSKGDWLNLAYRRVSSPGGIAQGGWRVGANQVVGAVFIGRNGNPNLEDQTNREGLREGRGFFDLQASVIKFVEFFEYSAHKSAKQRGEEEEKEALKKQAADSRKTAKKSIVEAKKLTKELKSVSDSKVRKKHVENLERQIHAANLALKRSEEDGNAYEKILQDELRALDDEKNTLSNLASLGILSVTFSHEALEHCNLAAAQANRLKVNYENGVFELMDHSAGKFLRNIEIIQKSTSFIRDFSKFALGNVRPDKRKMDTDLRLNDVIRDVFKALKQSLDEKNIVVDLTNASEKVAPIKGFSIDWESTLINLVANSIYALSHAKGNRGRTIRVKLVEADKHIEIFFADSADGLEAGVEKRIFEPKFSTRRDIKGNVTGTGMGLAIVQTFVEDHSSGTITVQPTSDLGGAEFRICVPRSDIKKKDQS